MDNESEESLILKFTLTIILEELKYVADIHRDRRFETPNSHPGLNNVHLKMVIVTTNGHNTETALSKCLPNL